VAGDSQLSNAVPVQLLLTDFYLWQK